MLKLSFKIWAVANLVIFFFFFVSLFPDGFGYGLRKSAKYIADLAINSNFNGALVKKILNVNTKLWRGFESFMINFVRHFL